MKRITRRLWTTEEYHYPGAYGYIPRLDGYLHEDDESRPCIIVAPGGAYLRCSPSEGEPVALKFYEMGYQAFVCSYTVNFVGVEPIGKQALNDLARAVRMVRKSAAEYHVDSERIAACGFSAGGHCVGSLGVHWQDVEENNPEYAGISCRPDAMILSYPLISVYSEIEWSGYGSAENLLGTKATEEEKNCMRLENHVTELCPSAFIWQTVTDEILSVRNSMVFAESCRRAGVKFALHLFSDGNHGLWVADETARTTLENYYTLESAKCVLEACERGDVNLTQEKRKKLLESQEASIIKDVNSVVKPSKYHPEAKQWVGLAENWLEQQWGKQAF